MGSVKLITGVVSGIDGVNGIDNEDKENKKRIVFNELKISGNGSASLFEIFIDVVLPPLVHFLF